MNTINFHKRKSLKKAKRSAVILAMDAVERAPKMLTGDTALMEQWDPNNNITGMDYAMYFGVRPLWLVHSKIIRHNHVMGISRFLVRLFLPCPVNSGVLWMENCPFYRV